MQARMSRTRAAAVGAVACVMVVSLSRALVNGATQNDSIAYWGCVGIGGALIGLAVAALRNRSRR